MPQRGLVYILQRISVLVEKDIGDMLDDAN
jgi:hypothetical protein